MKGQPLELGQHLLLLGVEGTLCRSHCHRFRALLVALVGLSLVKVLSQNHTEYFGMGRFSYAFGLAFVVDTKVVTGIGVKGLIWASLVSNSHKSVHSLRPSTCNLDMIN